ncbi:MAG: cell division protein ZapD [Pseudomonadota bacterium]|nr:cell division protein ZapD [Pseudomonadota bacterium]
MTDLICYEQPLNERLRLFLRLDHLFQSVFQQTAGTSEWQTRWVIEGLLDLMELVGRGDVKSELVKELERLAGSLTALERMPNVDSARLEKILTNMDALIDRLHAEGPTPATALNRSELLAGLRRRHHISGGKCDFDLPIFHFWLKQDPESRAADVQRWLDSLESLRLGVQLVLKLIRESAGFAEEFAEAGFFQRALDANRANQLLRVGLDRNGGLFPEISSGKHRFAIRFMEYSESERPRQTESRVGFRLSCCSL